MRKKYDYKLLQKYCKENNIELSKDYSNEKLNREIKIEGKCICENCEKYFNKTLIYLIKFGGYCKNCTEKLRQEKIEKTCLEKYGVNNPNKNKEIREKIDQTNLLRYGVKNVLQNKEIRKKMEDTCLKNNGVFFPSQNKEIREKIKQSCLKNNGVLFPTQCKEVMEKMKQNNLIKYGVENTSQSKEVKEKIKKTFITNYGVTHPFKNKEIKEKFKQTCLTKYGVEHPLQNAEVSEKASKNAYKLKNYTLPSGKIIKLQGYEHYGVDELIKEENISEHDIITNRSKVPNIWYEDKNGKKRRYFVDIFIPSQKRCIEIKSTWTMKVKKDNVLEKQQAMINAGYKCEIWVYSKHGERVEQYK